MCKSAKVSLIFSLQVNINACLSGVASATGGGTESDTTVTAEQKWKSSNVKAVVTNGKSIGENSEPIICNLEIKKS